MLKKVILLFTVALGGNVYAAESEDTAHEIEPHWMDIPVALLGGTNTHRASQMLGRKSGFSVDVKENLKNQYDMITTYPAAVACDMGSGLSRGLILSSFLRAGIESYYAKEGKKLETFKEMLINPESFINQKYASNIQKIAFSNKVLPAAVVAALAFHGLSYVVEPKLITKPAGE